MRPMGPVCPRRPPAPPGRVCHGAKMSTVLTVLVVCVFLALAGGIAYLWLRLHETSRREALQALAARRGWALTISEEKLGRPGVLRLMPRGGPTWTVETRNTGTALERPWRPVAQSTEFLTDDPRWDEGMIVIAGPLAEGTRPEGEGAPQNDPGRALIERLLGPETAAHAPLLQLWSAPGGATVLASAPPTPRIDLSDMGKHMAAWAGDSRTPPVIVLGPDGLRLHLPVGLRRADQMERFIDFALETARIL